MNQRDDVVIDYTNWRGERRERTVKPIGIAFTSTPHHPQLQWIMWALDEERAVLRAFAMKNIHSFSATPKTKGE